MEEDFLAVVAAHEAEAALAHQLLDLALHLRPARAARAPRRAAAGGRRARGRGRAVAVGEHELFAEQPRGHHQILEVRGFRREQHLVLAGSTTV